MNPRQIKKETEVGGNAVADEGVVITDRMNKRNTKDETKKPR